MYDIIIKNGTIIDGGRNKKFKADLGIKRERIAKIGKLKKANAKKIINARGLYTTPGFIDINNHSDGYWTLLTIPKASSLVSQGITTILGGNCGSSLAPLLSTESIKSIQKWADISKVNVNWLTVAQFFEELEKRKIGVNFATLVGHATLRRGLLKDEVRPITDEEMKIMENMLQRALKEGAFGMSSGLVYSHARPASTEELTRLAKIVKSFNGIYSSHIRGESEELLPAVKETIKIGKSSKVSIEISHLKAMGKHFWPNMEKAIKLIEQARKDYLDINFDIYPYTITGSVLYILLPDWVAEGGKKELIKRLKDPVIRAKVIKEMQKDKFDYDKITVAMCLGNKTLVGKKITEIARRQSKTIEEVIIDILIASDGHIIAFIDSLSVNNVKRGLKHPLSFICSDGFASSLEYAQRGDLVHPRCFGAFGRFLGEYVRRENLLSWEEAVYKITAGPAEKLGLKARGKIKKGYFADITIFDANSIIDKATFKNPFQYSQGIKYVIINGELVIDKGKHTGKLVGRVLRKS